MDSGAGAIDRWAEAGDADLAERAERLRLQRACESLRRWPQRLPLAAVAGAWLLWRGGTPAAALAWLVATAALQGLREYRVRRWQRRPPAVARAALRPLAQVFIAQAVLLALLAAWVFGTPDGDGPVLVTVLCIGLAAAALGESGWWPALFGLWATLVGGALFAGWWLQGSMAMAALVALLLALAVGHCSGQQQALRRQATLAWQQQQRADALRSERDRAQAAAEARTRFFAAAGHDLRQPLQALAINAYALSLLAQREGQAGMVQLADGIDRALRHSVGLLDDLLDVSRLDAGAMQPELRPFELAPLLDGLRRQFAPLAADRGLTLALETPALPLVVVSDIQLLRRMLVNLLGNALKFTREGGVRLVAEPAAAGRVRVGVADTGIGIAAADQQRVFDEFYQAANPARDRSQGLGLGLAIVRRLATLLELELRLDSAPGRGTRIDLWLPLGDAPAPPAPQPPQAEAAAGPLGLTVAVIADAPDSFEALCGLLQQLGCTAHAPDRLPVGAAPELIVCDPGPHAPQTWAAIDALRRRFGPLPALLLADAEPSALPPGGRLRVLRKPVDGAAIARSLRELAGRR